MRLTKLANWLSEGDLEKYQQQAQRASTAQAQLQKAELELEKLRNDFQQVQKELAQTKAQLQINQGFQIELGETQLKLEKTNTELEKTNIEVQRYKKELFEQTKQLNLLQSQLTQAKQAVARSHNWTEQITTPIQVKEIRKTLPKQDFETLWGFGIMSPKVKSITTTGAINIKGWVLGKKAKAETLRVTYQTETILETPIELRRPKIVGQYPDIPTAQNCGFEFALAVVGISDPAEFSLSVVLEDRSIVPLCIIVFQPDSIESKDT